MDTIIIEDYPKVSLEEFLPEMLLEIPEMPDDIMLHYIRLAVIEFCEKSLVLEREIIICTQECVENYILESPDAMRVIAVTGYCSDCGCEDVRRVTSNPCFISLLGKQVYWDRAKESIVIQPPPQGRENITVRVAVCPDYDACEVDRLLRDNHRLAILAGTRMMVYAISRQPWSSQPQADAARLEFDRRVARAGIDRLMGGQRGTVRIRGLLNGRRRRCLTAE